MMLRSCVVRLRPAPLIGAALLLAACSSSPSPLSSFSFGAKEPPAVDENAVPAKYRDAILTLVKTTQSFDPTNIREAVISEPVLKPVPAAGPGVSRYVVCTRFNPRNSNRQYSGATEYVAYFFGGELNQFVKATGGVCTGVAYAPFPELEKICLAEKCT
jgi:hypothetical protein